MAALGDLPQTQHPVQPVHIDGDSITIEGVGLGAADDLATVLATAAGVEIPAPGLAWIEGNPFSMVPIGPQRFLDLYLSNDYR